MFVSVTWHLEIGVLSERSIYFIEELKESTSLSDRILLSLNSGIWVIRNNAALCQAKSESRWHNSKISQNWLMPSLRVWVTTRLTKNTWMFAVPCQSLFSFCLQNKSALPQCRHDAALKVFSWGDRLLSGSDVRVCWPHHLSLPLASGLIWRHAFLSAPPSGPLLEGVWSVGREDSHFHLGISFLKHVSLAFKEDMFALISVLKGIMLLRAL